MPSVNNGLKGIFLFFKPDDFRTKFRLVKKKIIKEIRTEAKGIKVALNHYYIILYSCLGHRTFFRIYLVVT